LSLAARGRVRAHRRFPARAKTGGPSLLLVAWSKTSKSSQYAPVASGAGGARRRGRVLRARFGAASHPRRWKRGCRSRKWGDPERTGARH
jgi:hypothetical protein